MLGSVWCIQIKSNLVNSSLLKPTRTKGTKPSRTRTWIRSFRTRIHCYEHWNTNVEELLIENCYTYRSKISFIMLTLPSKFQFTLNCIPKIGPLQYWTISSYATFLSILSKIELNLMYRIHLISKLLRRSHDVLQD